MEPTDELFPVVQMEPKRSYDVEISTPGRIAALEAENAQLRGIGDRLAADCAAWEARVERMDCEAEQLQSQVKTRDSQNHEAMLKLVLSGTRLVELEVEVERLREVCTIMHTRVLFMKNQGRITVPDALWLADRLYPMLEVEP